MDKVEVKNWRMTVEAAKPGAAAPVARSVGPPTVAEMEAKFRDLDKYGLIPKDACINFGVKL